MPDGDVQYPDLAPLFPAANRMQRAAFDLVGVPRRRRRPAAVALARELADRPVSVAARLRRAGEVATRRRAVRVREGRGRRRARDSRRSRPCRHHRAGALPVPGRRREGAAPGGTPGLGAQGHRKALRVDVARGRHPPRRPGFGRLDGRIRVGVRAGAGGDRRGVHAAGARRVAARAAARTRAHRQSPGRPGLPGQRRGLRVRARAVLPAQGRRAAHEPRGLRPPAADGRDRARRRRARPHAARHRPHPRRVRDDRGADADRARHLRRSRGHAGPLPQLRSRHAGARAQAGTHRAARARQRPGVRPAPRSSRRPLR